MKELLNNVQFFLDHPLLSNSLVIAVGLLAIKIYTRRQNKKAIIEINKEAEKIKYEIQRKYLLAEIRTRHLLKIYPKLYDTMLNAAGPFVLYFTTILNKIDEAKLDNKEYNENDLKLLLNDYLNPLFNNDTTFGGTALQTFSNQLTESALFISDEVNNILNDIKKDAHDLWKIVKKEIVYGKYEKYTLDQLKDLIDRSSVIVTRLCQDKDHLARLMNKELDPEP